jgi:hypothetical protein
MKKILTHTMLGLLMLGLFSTAGLAQEKEGKIKIKITRDIDGEERTYEGTYETEEQMREDHALQEFMGDEDFKTNFWFGGPYNKAFELEEGENGNSFMFRFDDKEGPYHFQFDMDSTMKALERQLTKQIVVATDLAEAQEKLAEMDIDIDFDFTDSLARQIEVQMQRMHEQMEDMDRQIEVRVIKHIEITEEVGKEFGKKGTVKESHQLLIPDLSYYPNPSPNGRFKLRFDAPGEGSLAIKIYNLDGKEVFNRFFENFQGLYSESIDLSGQSEGTYLLEIQQDGKRLTRKIVID